MRGAAEPRGALGAAPGRGWARAPGPAVRGSPTGCHACSTGDSDGERPGEGPEVGASRGRREPPAFCREAGGGMEHQRPSSSSSSSSLCPASSPLLAGPEATHGRLLGHPEPCQGEEQGRDSSGCHRAPGCCRRASPPCPNAGLLLPLWGLLAVGKCFGGGRGRAAPHKAQHTQGIKPCRVTSLSPRAGTEKPSGGTMGQRWDSPAGALSSAWGAGGSHRLLGEGSGTSAPKSPCPPPLVVSGPLHLCPQLVTEPGQHPQWRVHLTLARAGLQVPAEKGHRVTWHQASRSSCVPLCHPSASYS